MREWIELQKKLYPDVLEVVQNRYRLLHYVQLMEPIGRRALADNMNLAERTIRSEINFLQQQGMVHVTTRGLLLTAEGHNVLDEMADYMKEVSGAKVLEAQLKEKLKLKTVIVVPGDSDEYDWVKQEMGKACVSYLQSISTTAQTIAVTGGTTMAAVAARMTPFSGMENTLFVPARGGLGERVEHQANTICVEMARKVRGNYRLLYVPDPISEESYQTIIEEPSVKSILGIIRTSDIVIHSLGDAITMAERRKTPDDQLATIKENQAVGEAFGYYFNQNGEVVHKVRTVGLQLEDLEKDKQVIAVAGGHSKADAIASYFRPGKSNVLITDEGAAKELIRDSSL
ncbi:sugar-binding transcriptional regulator [Salimicrobium flavidum]|uniref:Central glycolytic genes regulator n=1 Tax=Salimicrobium flavidum TaxID=570947 RepID=A0A1N7J2A3_9BACI|nr:sugar-binding domain-containing protein [Salimicrobium flavidum]SIS43361.1 central glycolytic genes regulator [Salimicrobium flavidum]